MPAGGPSDAVLMEAVLRHDQQALEALYDRYARRIFVMAAHLLGPAEAEEVVQETFVRLWTRASQFESKRGTLRTWLMAIARHYALNTLRKRPSADRVAALDEVDRLFEDTADPAPGVETVAWERERSRRALEQLRELPAEQRKVLVLAYFGGFSQSEIAQALGCPIGTVKTRTRLGLEKLRAGLGQLLGEASADLPGPRAGKEEVV